MTLDELNREVTQAILLAERQPPGSVQAAWAFGKVSKLEEAIADVTSVDDVRGLISRVGAVTGALSADDPLRALFLIARYRDEIQSEDVRARLAELETDAQAVLDEQSKSTPDVESVSFRLAS